MWAELSIYPGGCTWEKLVQTKMGSQKKYHPVVPGNCQDCIQTHRRHRGGWAWLATKLRREMPSVLHRLQAAEHIKLADPAKRLGWRYLMVAGHLAGGEVR